MTGLNNFYQHFKENTPSNVVIRTHVHPQKFAADIMDYIDQDEECVARNIVCSPTSFSHVLVAVMLEAERVSWGLYTADQYRDTICRPGDGDRSPVFDLNFNRAELKIAEALQLVSPTDTHHLFSKPLLALDVGASPGGWTGYLARMSSCRVSVLAIDPGALAPDIASLTNVTHLACKAEHVSDDNGAMLTREAEKLVGSDWRQQFRLLVCDANLDIRDTLRELVLPLATLLPQGGLVIITLKLGRRVGTEGIARKQKSATELLTEAGFTDIRFEWLFGNSKNERTIFAKKL